jgi:hypothetical protein
VEIPAARPAVCLRLKWRHHKDGDAGINGLRAALDLALSILTERQQMIMAHPSSTISEDCKIKDR